MRSVVLLLLGVHLAYAGTHSLKYFFTAVSGDIDFPEFTIVGLVDEGQFFYFDSNLKKAVPKTEWMSREGADYWDSQTQIATGEHQNFRNNIQILKERFNQSKGVHTFQMMVGCELEDDGSSTRGYWQYGYDGEDFIILDKSTLTWTAAKDQAVITKHKWEANNADKQYRKTYLENTCIEWVQKYVGYGKDTLERKDPPEVSLLQKDPSSPVSCHATGFYPSNIMMSWQKNQEDHHEDVEIGSTLPNIDGTFQKTITLKPEAWKNNKESIRCVVQHVGAEKDIVVTVKDIRSNTGSDNMIAIIVGCLAAVAVLAAIVGLILWKKSPLGYGKASNKDTDSENSDQPLPQVTTK